MKIDVAGSTITIECSEPIMPRHLSQLMAVWRFKRQKNEDKTLFSRDNSDPEALGAVIEYFVEEEVEFELSQAARAYYEHETRRSELIRQKKVDGSQFKDGQFDTQEFQEFQQFLRTRLVRRLKLHQEKAAFHLYRVSNGANFSVPGSGKTSVVLAVYERLRHEGKANFLFVVGPPSCFGPWAIEFRDTLGRLPNPVTFAGGNKIQRKNQYYRLPNPTEELFLTTFQSLAKDVDDVKAMFNFAGAKPFLVVDEAHYIKQLGGVWASAVLEIAPRSAVRCILTGTPMPNAFSDIFNLSDFLWGENQILNLDDKSRVLIAEEDAQTDEAKSILRESISPFFYRVRKQDLGLSEQIFHSYLIPMNEAERKLYSAIVTRIREYAQYDYVRNIDLVNRLRRGRMMRLRQCFSYAKMLASALEGYDENLVDEDSELAQYIRDYDAIEGPAKLEFLLNMVQEFRSRDEKVVIWSNFVAVIDLISQALTNDGIHNKCILGRTPKGVFDELSDESANSLREALTREQIRNEFIDPKSGLNVLIANPAACAESISLHKTCQNAIYYDLTYNCAQYLQSLDRIHRVGGSELKESHYHFLQYEDTVEQNIKSVLDGKAQRMYEIIDDDFEVYSLDMLDEDEDLTVYRKLFG